MKNLLPVVLFPSFLIMKCVGWPIQVNDSFLINTR